MPGFTWLRWWRSGGMGWPGLWDSMGQEAIKLYQKPCQNPFKKSEHKEKNLLFLQ